MKLTVKIILEVKEQVRRHILFFLIFTFVCFGQTNPSGQNPAGTGVEDIQTTLGGGHALS
jgi:hypothetical protein